MTRIVYLGLGLLTLLVTILYCGISRDPEFYEPSIFVKYRPTTKIHFYTPTGESDMTLEDLTEEGKKEELLYNEFVADQKIYSDNLNRLWFLPPILIQLTLTFFSFGALGRSGLHPKIPLVHILINFFPTFLLVGLMLFNEKPWQLLGLAMTVLSINLLTLRFTQRKAGHQEQVSRR